MESSRTNRADTEASSSHSKYGETSPLNLGCRIFISHSGKDKNFVRYLHYMLVEKVYHDDGIVFFDEESLPTAEPISMQNILPEAEGCELGVLVLTEDFFTHTQNPMLELLTLTTSEKRLLPLFFKISVGEFKKRRDENVWEEKWKEWLKGDEIALGKWKDAVKFVDRYSGLEHCKLGGNECDYIKIIASKVARIVRPAVSHSKEGVCGMDRICKIVDDMYNQCALKRASDGCTQVVSTSGSASRRADSGYSLDLVGIYGFAGLGKSTLCHCLLDFYFPDFHGNMCWLDLGSVPIGSGQALSQKQSRMLHLLKRTGFDIDIHGQPETVPQISNLVRMRSWRKPIFLAIDNILPDSESLEEAEFYLDCEFAKGSKIFITSRSEKILKHVISKYSKFSAVIKCIPKLKFEEARDIFVREIPKLASQMSNMEDEVKACVNVCVYRTSSFDSDNEWYVTEWYHPLMLMSSGASIKHARLGCNADLKSRLRKFIQSAAAVEKGNAWKMVFDMLDISFAILSDDEKKVFLDLSVFHKVIEQQSGRESTSHAWIKSIHSHRLDEEKVDEILLFLEDLSFFVTVGDKSEKRLQMHNLMVDFSQYKIMQAILEPGAANLNVLALDNGAELRNPAFCFLLANSISTSYGQWPSLSALPKSVRTVSISGWDAQLEQPDLRNFEGVEVLHLAENSGVQEVLLSPSTVAHLRSFIVHGPYCGPTYLRCTIDESSSTPTGPSQTMKGGNLVWVELTGNVIFSAHRKPRSAWAGGAKKFFQRFESSRSSTLGLGILQPLLRNLQYLRLSHFPAKNIDVTPCTNLKTLILRNMPNLRGIHGLETLTNLEVLRIFECHFKIINVTACTNLKSLNLASMPSLRDIHGLQTSTNLDDVSIWDCKELQLLCIPTNRMLSANVGRCGRLERISLLTVPQPDTSYRRPRHYYYLYVAHCPALRKVDGIAQYIGHCILSGILDLVELFEAGSHKLKGTVTHLELDGYPLQGLAGLKGLTVTDVQHVGLLISALDVKSRAATCHLESLTIHCKEDGDCGCDKNESHFGPGLSPSGLFEYCCPQVRNLVSLPLFIGNGLRHLTLSGCNNVEVWPDFTTMTSLESLDLACTSLKEWPTGVQQLPRLNELDIQGCLQLSAEEMMKAITCKAHNWNSACDSGSLKSLLADLRGLRRDPVSVADALDARWPDLVFLFHLLRRYLRCPRPPLYSEDEELMRGSEVCYLIRVMYDLWFGVECEAGSTRPSYYGCADGVPTIKEKMRRLLCSEAFMSLPFYVWRIGRTRQHALDEWEEYPWPEGYEIYMAFALIGCASIGCFNASLNDDLKDRISNFVQSFAEAQPQRAVKDLDKLNLQPVNYELPEQLDKDAHERLVMRVGDAVCKMARAPSMAAALGHDFMHITMDGLKASYEFVESSGVESWIYHRLPLSMRHRSARKPRVVATQLGQAEAEASVHDSSINDGLGARVLHKIMPKIMPLSVLEFYPLFGFKSCYHCTTSKNKMKSMCRLKPKVTGLSALAMPDDTYSP